MRVAVLGLGDFGYSLAYWLDALGNEVIAVDKSNAPVQRIMGNVSKAIVADVSDRETLEEIGIRDVDVALVAVGRRLETSVLLAHWLREAGVPRIVVKVVDQEQGDILRLVGATLIVQPDRDIAARVAASLTFPGVVDYVTLRGQTRILAVKAPPHFVGRTLADLRGPLGEHARVIAVDPAGDDQAPCVPGETYVVGERDTLVLLGDLAHLLEALSE